MLTPEEQAKGYLSFQNEAVDPTGQKSGTGGTVVRRYTQPTAAPAVAAPTPTPSPAGDLSNGGLNFDQFKSNIYSGVDENAIREQTRKDMQATIDAINAETATRLAEQNVQNENNLGQTRAVNARSGTIGSDFGNANMANQQTKNNQAVKAIQDEQTAKIADVNNRISQAAKEEIAAKKAQALGDANSYAAYLEKSKTEAKDMLGQLAGAGIDLATLDPSRKSYLFKAAGLDDSLGELVYNSLKPKAGRIDYKAEKAADGQILLYGVDPTTGELKQHRINFNVPEGYEPAYVDGCGFRAMAISIPKCRR